MCGSNADEKVKQVDLFLFKHHLELVLPKH